MKNKVLIFLIIVILSVGFLVAGEVKAGDEHNVYGWAWSENIGWISFNSTTDESGVNYGVHIDAVGNFSGYAWSDSIGWISFNPGDLAGCPILLCEASIDLVTGEVSGWARAYRAIVPLGQTLGGWDGWIGLSGSWADGVSLNTTSGPPYEFEGWAWGSDVVGWISFNDKDLTGLSGSFDYQVMTNLIIGPVPSATNLTVTEGDYCSPITEGFQSGGSRSSPPIIFNWTFDDPEDTQNGYMIAIDDDSNLDDDPIDSTPPRGCSLNQTPYYVNTQGAEGPDYSCTPADLNFNTTYWWRLKVWDSGGVESDWIDSPSTFSTDTHRWPNAKFTPDITNPPAGVEVTFMDESTCYDAVGSYNCESLVATSYIWDFDYTGVMDVDSTAKGTVTYTYSIQGDYIVRLEVADVIGMCPYQYPLTSKLPLPKWEEIAPF